MGFLASKTNYWSIPSSRLYAWDAGGPLLMIYINAIYGTHVASMEVYLKDDFLSLAI